MPTAFAAFGVAFATIFLAELGDKSQVLLLAQAARAPARRVLAEALAAFAILSILAVSVGGALARLLPGWSLVLAAGLLFLVFGTLAIREAREADRGHDPLARRSGGTFVLVLLSEMGDKTQLATAALAASTGQAVAVGLGAFTALAASSVLAVLAGRWLGTRLDVRRRAWIAAALFLGLGVATLAWLVWNAR